MNIAFWGGCINRQQNIAADKHYHAIVKQAVVSETGTAPRSWLRFYSSFHELKCEAEEMLQRDTHYDYLVIFLRPYTLMPLTRLLVRYTDKNMHPRLALNPRFSKTKYYDSMIKEYKVVVQNKSEGSLVHKTFQQLNDLAGDLLHLPQWAQQEVICILEDIYTLASQKGTQLVLLGPPLYPANKRVSKSCIELNQKISLFAAARSIVHVDMATPFNQEGQPFSEPDGKHVTAAGHAFMAEGILKHLLANKAQQAPEAVLLTL